MLGDGELERLRLQKEALKQECETRRLALIAEWKQLTSADFWLNEAGQAARRHPWLTVALGVGAGLLAVQAVRRPGRVFNWLGRIGGSISSFRAIKNLFDGAS